MDIGAGAGEDGAVIARVAAAPSRLRLGEIAEAAPGWLRAQVALQAHRWILWGAVAFGAGCGIYFKLMSEPAAWLLYALAGVAAMVALAAVRWAPKPVAYGAALLAVMALGVAVAKHRTDVVAAPIVPPNLGMTTIEGYVVDLAGVGARGEKVVIAPVWIDRLSPARTPIRIRMVLQGKAPPPGSPIRVRAILDPPPPPSSPGAHDFPRDFYFKSLGGVGLALGATQPAYRLDPPPWGLRVSMAVNRWRWSLAQKIADAVGPDEAGPAVAMTVGEDNYLSEEQRNAMRDAGLAHLLAIGGLHMGIVASFVFFLTRLGVAAWPWLALRVNGKKVAAGAGLITVGVYLLMSGAAPSAERAAITASTAFAAILLNRKAITFNALAFAAIVVLLLRPESIVGASFQMSFSATMALVALAEAWPHRIREISAPLPILAFQRTASWIGAGLLASFVAGAATGPFSIYQFNTTANYGVLGNALEMPISTFLTLPCLALGAVLQLAGLGKPVLFLADLGLQWTLSIGRWVSSLPHAVTTIASPATIALPLSFLGVCFTCLWRGKLRWLGLPLACAVFWWPRYPAPDVWISADGSNAAIRSGGYAIPLRPDVKQFDINLWSQRRNLKPPADPAAAVTQRFDCDRTACKQNPGSAFRISGWWRNKAPPDARFAGLCAGTDLVIVRGEVDRIPPACRGVAILDGLDFRRGGAAELWRSGNGWAAVWSADRRGDRPWSRTQR
ncbi:MAG TPA: ComEC/Rec2 family competence protein [Caulobacteraceae bacterium]|nr:ComEC/Rec2 family competence protein [Caulobacteraceae bacterium]